MTRTFQESGKVSRSRLTFVLPPIVQVASPKFTKTLLAVYIPFSSFIQLIQCCTLLLIFDDSDHSIYEYDPYLNNNKKSTCTKLGSASMWHYAGAGYHHDKSDGSFQRKRPRCGAVNRSQSPSHFLQKFPRHQGRHQGHTLLPVRVILRSSSHHPFF